MKSSEVLKAGADYYETHYGSWCKNVYARDKAGHHTYPSSLNAHSFCAAGMIAHFTSKTPGLWANNNDPLTYIMRQLEIEGGPYSIGHWNDFKAKRKRDVIRLFRRAANLAEKSND